MQQHRNLSVMMHNTPHAVPDLNSIPALKDSLKQAEIRSRKQSAAGEQREQDKSYISKLIARHQN